jgi:hypothetical protein
MIYALDVSMDLNNFFFDTFFNVRQLRSLHARRLEKVRI